MVPPSRLPANRTLSETRECLTCLETIHGSVRMNATTFDVKANGASIAYTYDDAGRVFWIEHWDINDERMVLFEYWYDARNLVTKRMERLPTTWPTITNSFRYDERGRLYREYRLFDPPYDYEYEYDQTFWGQSAFRR